MNPLSDPRAGWLRWLAASGGAWAVGHLVGAWVAISSAASAVDSSAPRAQRLILILGAAVGGILLGGAVQGAISSALTWLLLRRHGVPYRRWGAANIVGWMLASLAIWPLVLVLQQDALLIALLLLAAIALLIGGAQWLALRPHLAQPGRWVGLSLAGGLLGALLLYGNRIDGHVVWNLGWRPDWSGVPPGANRRPRAPERLISFRGRLYFLADDGRAGSDLWQSDGTAAGTALVKDINPDKYSSTVSDLTLAGDRLFMVASGASGRDLWVSDGTAAGTTLVKRIRSGLRVSPPRDLWAANGRVLFYYRSPDQEHGGLWISDGTPDGTVMLDTALFGGPLVALGPARPGVALFAGTSRTVGTELWATDGTAAGTALVKDINPAPHGSTGADSTPQWLTPFGGQIIFSAADGLHGRELWRSDGTAAGTVLVRDLNVGPNGSYPRECITLNGALYFVADDAQRAHTLWRSDGTAAGTAPLALALASPDRFNPQRLVVVGDRFFFAAAQPWATAQTSGCALWVSDGTAAGTQMVKDICPEAMVALGDRVAVAGGEPQYGHALWISDGTAAGTRALQTFAAAYPASPRELTVVGDTLFFVATDGRSGDVLWRSDGTPAGTHPVRGPAP